MGYFRMRFKLSMLLIVAAIVPLSVLGYIALDRQETLISSHVASMNHGFARMIAFHVYNYVSGSRSLFEKLLHSEQFRRFDPAAMEQLLRTAMAETPSIDGVVVFDIEKQPIVRVGRQVRMTQLSGLFTDALFDKYGRGVRGLGDQPNLAMPIWGPDGRLTGILIAFLDMRNLTGQLDEMLQQLTEIYEDLDIYVLDQNEQLIVGSRGVALGLDPSRYLGLNRGKDGYFDIHIKSFYSYETPPWRIVTIHRPQARSSLDHLAFLLKEIIGVSVVIAIVFGLAFAAGITRPLHQLVQSAATISKGDLSKPVEIHSRDEIGELAEGFETMRQNLRRYQSNLKDRIRELQTLYDVGRAISSTLEFNKLLEIILDLVIKTLKAERGSIMLLDERSNELRIQAARGLPPDIIRKTRVKLGERISGYVLETGRPLLIIDTEKSPNFSKLKDGRIASGTMLSVPLIAKEKRLGVLNVSKSVAYSFDDRDLELFTALANQAAIAIDNARLYLMAITDELTKLYIRRFFQQRLREELRRARRYRHPCTVINLDIDHFKKFNDTYGHQQGDMVLVHVAQKLLECVRNVDIVARLGGEEFAIICPEQSAQQSLVPAERIRRSIEAAELDLGVDKVNITVSIGVADFPNDADTERDVMEFADQAMYFGKQTGRNRVIMWSDVSEEHKRTVLEADSGKDANDDEQEDLA